MGYGDPEDDVRRDRLTGLVGRDAPIDRLDHCMDHRRPNQSKLIGKTKGWKHTLTALTTHHGARVGEKRLRPSSRAAFKCWRPVVPDR